jgi:hypothetical protein
MVSNSKVALFKAGISYLVILLDIPSKLFSEFSATFYIIICKAFYLIYILRCSIQRLRRINHLLFLYQTYFI